MVKHQFLVVMKLYQRQKLIFLCYTFCYSDYTMNIVDTFPEEILVAILDCSIDNKVNYFSQTLVCKKWHEIVVEIWKRRMDASTQNFVSELQESEIENLRQALRYVKSFSRKQFPLIMHLCGGYQQPHDLLNKQMGVNTLKYVLHRYSKHENFIHKFLAGMHIYVSSKYSLNMYKEVEKDNILTIYYDDYTFMQYSHSDGADNTELNEKNFPQLCKALGVKPIPFKEFERIMSYVAQSNNFQVNDRDESENEESDENEEGEESEVDGCKRI
jgi:hypothetical protein